tara:strand:- start:1663 stop:1896 length:234 start_codon:yes stop_codon:yes gene_type:complete
MSAQSQLEVLVTTLIESGADHDRITSLQDSFNDQQVEVFLEKLSTLESLDALIDSPSNNPDQSNQLIDIVSELIISK